ncbi:MAG: hypothetical protein JWO65_1990 [Sphingomonas bacterium]|nr:hypothetical protein [Sphingomonas bacterium]
MRMLVIGVAGLTLAAASPAYAQTPAPAVPGPADITVNGHQAPAFVPLVGSSDFVSPMGEPFRSKDALSGAEHWFERANSKGDGRLTLGEFRADADRFFQLLDTNHDGEIDPDEIEHYETDVAPEIRVISTYGDATLAKTDDDGKVTDPPYPTRLGAGRFGYLDMPEPVVSADANMDRAISRLEFQQAADRRFKMLDTNGDGAITRDELPKLGSTRRDESGRPHGKPGGGRRGGGHHGGMGGGDMGGMGGGMGGMGGMGGGMGPGNGY